MNQKAYYASERLNLELISMLSKMDSLAQEMMDGCGCPLARRLTLEFEDSGHAEDYFNEDGTWTTTAKREARLMLMQAALWLAEQLNDSSGGSALRDQSCNADLLTLYLNARERQQIEVAA